MEKRVAVRYAVVAIIFIGLIGMLFVLRSNLLGFAVFEDTSQENFSIGTYENTTHNGTAVVLSGNNLSGSYTSQVFDAGTDSAWNNLTYNSEEPEQNDSISVLPQLALVLDKIRATETELTSSQIGQINKSDDSSFSFQINKNIEYAYLRINWTNNLPSLSTINSVNITLEQRVSNTGEILSLKGQVYINEGYTDVCSFSLSTSDITEYCDLFPYINTSNDVNNIDFRILVNGLTGKEPYEYVDYVILDGDYTKLTNLSFQVKNCSQSDCSDGSWQTADLDNLNLIGRYFQYKVLFESPDSSITPELYNVTIDYTILNTAPSVSLVSPQEGATYGYNESIALDFIADDNDDNIDSCWYNIDGGDNIIIADCENTTFDVAEGSKTLTVYVNDSYGLEGSDSVTFIVQVGAPTIMLNSPIDIYLDSETVTFSYTPTDVDLDDCELWGDFTGEFQLNQTEVSPTSGIENTFSLILEDGTYLWNIRCEDSLGNSAFNGNKTFYVDTTSPGISLTQPTGTKTSRTISASWSIIDASPISCIYNVYRGENIEVANTSIDCGFNNVTFNVTVDASFIFNFYVNDSAGNENSSSLSFSVDTSTSPPVNGGSGGGGGGGSAAGSAISKDKLEITKISDLIVNPGESKKMVLHVQNIGKDFLNDCKLIGEGENEKWVSSTDVKSLSGGQKEDFIFTLNIPNELGTGSYEVSLSLKCQEYNQSTSFFAEIIEKKLAVDLINIERTSKDRVKIIYSLVELSDIEQEVEVEIILFGLENERIAEYTEKKKIEASSTNEFEAVLEIPENLEGSFNLLINAISDTSSTFVQEEVILGSSEIGGLAILDTRTRDILFSGILIVVFLVFTVLIVKRILKLRILKKVKDKSKGVLVMGSK